MKKILMFQKIRILKYSVPEFVNNNSNLMNMINEITDAKIEDGGGGAFYIFLKKKIENINISA